MSTGWPETLPYESVWHPMQGEVVASATWASPWHPEQVVGPFACCGCGEALYAATIWLASFMPPVPLWHWAQKLLPTGEPLAVPVRVKVVALTVVLPTEPGCPPVSVPTWQPEQ